MKKHPKPEPLKRLARIRGQIDGIARMIEEERDCMEILVQTRAIHAALRKVEETLLRAQVERSVTSALGPPDADQGREQLDALINMLNRYGGG